MRNSDIEEVMLYFQSVYSTVTDSMEMPPADYSGIKIPWNPFYAAIIQGDVALLECMLDSVQNMEIVKLMCNACIDYESAWFSNRDQDKYVNALQNDKFINVKYFKNLSEKKLSEMVKLQFELPMAVAAASGDLDTVMLLLKHCSNLHSVDSKMCNICHNLITLARDKPHEAVQFYKVIMQACESPEEKCTLATAKNAEGYTPLSLAAKTHTFSFVYCLLQTEGVYKFVTQDCGSFRHVLYDLTDYEGDLSQSKQKYHFLYNLALIHEHELEFFQKYQVLSREPFLSWRKSKIQMYNSNSMIWFVCWIFYLTVYFTKIGIFYLTDKHEISEISSIILLILSILIMFGQLWYVFLERHVYKYVFVTWREHGLPVAYKTYYLIFQLIFSVLVVITESLHLGGLYCPGHETVFLTLYTLSAACGCLSLLVFTQFSRQAAHILTLMDRVLWTVLLFLLLWAIVFCLFVFGFYILNYNHHCGQQYNTTDDDEMFRTLGLSCYDTFVLGLEVVPPNPLYFDNSEMKLFSMVMYCIFLILVPVVMMNLMVATFTANVSNLNKYREIIKELQFLFVALLMEALASTLIIFPIGIVHQKTRKKFFVVDEDRVFLRVVEKLPHLQEQDFARSSRTKTS